MYGAKVMVDEPLIKSALLVLYRLWPRSTAFEDLWTAALDSLGQSEATVGVDRTSFATSLLQCHMLLLVNLHTCDPSIATEPGERPRTTALALRDAASGKRVISLRNYTAVLEDIDRLVLALLDGTRDQACTCRAPGWRGRGGEVEASFERPADHRAGRGPRGPLANAQAKSPADRRPGTSGRRTPIR